MQQCLGITSSCFLFVPYLPTQHSKKDDLQLHVLKGVADNRKSWQWHYEDMFDMLAAVIWFQLLLDFNSYMDKTVG